MDVSLAYMFKGTGRCIRAYARALCVWRGDYHDEYRRGGNHHLRHHAVCEALVRRISLQFDYALYNRLDSNYFCGNCGFSAKTACILDKFGVFGVLTE